jgi:hypothetical protein
LLLAVAPATADILYDNGPYNGTTDAWQINFGFSVSDLFTLSPTNAITFASYKASTLSPGISRTTI